MPCSGSAGAKAACIALRSGERGKDMNYLNRANDRQTGENHANKDFSLRWMAMLDRRHAAPHPRTSRQGRRRRVAWTIERPAAGLHRTVQRQDFTGWRLSPKAKEMWSIEDGVLKSPGLLREWGADLVTEKTYRDFVLLLDFRMPTLSDSGIMFRRLIPAIPNFGDQEQFNLRSKDGVGQLESYYFLPHGIARNRNSGRKTNRISGSSIRKSESGTPSS